MMLVIFLSSYFVLLLSFVFIMLFGPSPTWKDTPIAWIYDYLTDGCFKQLHRGIASICGKKFADRLKSAGNSLQTQSHPLMAMFFMTLLCVGTFIFFGFVFPKMPNKYFGGYLYTFTVWPTIIAPYLFFFLSMFSDPGKITKSNVHRMLALYEYDYLIYAPKTCETCKLPKPARSKHCSLCQACVARHDHHCVWVNNCVGRNNHRWFLLFLASTSWITSYGSWAVMQTLRAEMERRNVDRFWYLDRGTGQRRRLSWSEKWMYMMSEEGPAMALAAFLFLAFIVLFLFLLYQLYLVVQGTTTNEVAKWEDVHDAMQENKQLVIRKPKGQATPAHFTAAVKEASKFAPENLRNRKSGIVKEEERAPTPVQDEAIGDVDLEWEVRTVTSYDDLENLYNAGWWRNLWEVMFPPA